MKKTIIGVALVAIAFTANAQDKKGSDKSLKFSVGLEAGLPLSGGVKTATSFGIGGSVQAEYAAAENIGLTLNAGYLTFLGKTVGGVKQGSVNFIPVLAGAKFYFTEKVYGHAQIGMTFASQKILGQSISTSAFTYAPGIGFNAAENFDIEVKYQAYSKGGSVSFIGLRAAYSF